MKLKNTKGQQLFSGAASDAERPMTKNRTIAANATEASLKKMSDSKDSGYQEGPRNYEAFEVRHRGVFKHIKKNGKWIS